MVQTMTPEQFTDEEISIVKETLEDYVSGITAEISGATRLSVGTAQELMHKKALIENLIERIETRAA